MNGIDANECGLDIPIGELVPLKKRDINLKRALPGLAWEIPLVDVDCAA